MTKQQIWEEAQELLVGAKASKKLLNEMEALLAPKKGGGGSANPPKLNDKGEIVEAFCKFHQRYEKVEDMVISGGKSKGYCKAGISAWNKTNARIKSFESKAVEFMADGDFDAAKKEAERAKELKDNYNDPKFYDYDRDWKIFLANK